MEAKIVDHSTNWRQVAFAAVTQNLATGFTFGSFGTLVLAIESEYGASRSQSALALSLAVLSLSLTSSILGRFLETYSIRPVMAAGAFLSAAGWMAISFAQGPLQLILCYALILGPATSMLGVLPSMTHAARWTSLTRQGVSMGLVNAPLFVMLVPLAIAPVMEAYGVRKAFQLLAIIDLIAIPFILLCFRERVVEVLPGHDEVESGETESLLKKPIFWILIVAQGLIAGAGMMKLAHLVPLLTEVGRTFDEANLLLAISGGAGLIGTFAFGALADRIGGSGALALNAVIQAVVWTVFLTPVSYSVLVIDAIIVGACGGGLQAAFGAALVGLFGPKRFSTAFGLASILTLPFLFGLPPAASLIYEASGSYFLPMGIMVGLLFAAAIFFGFAVRSERRSKFAPNVVIEGA